MIKGKVTKGFFGADVKQFIDNSMCPIFPPQPTQHYYYQNKIIFQDHQGEQWFGIYEDHQYKLIFCSNTKGSKKLFVFSELKKIS